MNTEEEWQGWSDELPRVTYTARVQTTDKVVVREYENFGEAIISAAERTQQAKQMKLKTRYEAVKI